jgi:hypothetical protein
VQSVVSTQEIAVSVGPHLTLGSGIRFQAWPLNCSAAAICTPREPTARQKRLETHETPVSALPRTDPSGVACTLHPVPFHTSTTARALPPPLKPARDIRPDVWVEPTATQNVGDTHESDTSAGLAPTAGVARTAQEAPSQRSAKVAIGPSSIVCEWSNPKSELPTAMQNVADTQETLVTEAFGGPLGRGMAWGAHVAADAGAATPTLTRPQTTAARRTHLPIPIPIRMSCKTNIRLHG